VEEALEEMKMLTGKVFDPEIFKVFLNLRAEDREHGIMVNNQWSTINN
jgi:HD-GYP domain-containing protein (c-di-GMP phosphodiesterase class II)